MVEDSRKARFERMVEGGRRKMLAFGRGEDGCVRATDSGLHRIASRLVAEILLNLDYCVELETPKLERSGGSMGSAASAQERSAEVQTGLAHLYKRICDEVWLNRNV